MTVPRWVAIVALALCFFAGYFLAGWWSSARDTSLAQICARVDYVNGLQENLKGQEAASEEVRAEFKALVEQCRAALRNPAEKTTKGMKKKKERRVYLPRVLGSGQVMMPADLKRLHRYMLEIEHISVISDEVRAVVESEWPELAHKLPPKKPQG
jgi:hypothetical protein